MDRTVGIGLEGRDEVLSYVCNDGVTIGGALVLDESIEVVGENIESFVDENFEVIRTPPVPSSGGRMKTFIKNRISPRPAIDLVKCTICGTCVEMCPVDPKAVDWHKGDKSKSPTYKYGRCIRCYCCQETCPEGAISVDNPLLGRIFFPLK